MPQQSTLNSPGAQVCSRPPGHSEAKDKLPIAHISPRLQQNLQALLWFCHLRNKAHPCPARKPTHSSVHTCVCQPASPYYNHGTRSTGQELAALYVLQKNTTGVLFTCSTSGLRRPRGSLELGQPSLYWSCHPCICPVNSTHINDHIVSL